MSLYVGDWVEVRSKQEILQTLDKNGRLEGLPFMPQMFQYCGQKFQVYKSAHKTCDFVYTMSSRRLPKGVHLDLRCDGAAYGGCQHSCLLFWKEDWLIPIGKTEEETSHNPRPVAGVGRCTEQDVLTGTRYTDADNQVIYTCQGTEILNFTKPLPWWDIAQYWDDYRSGNVGITRLINGFAYGLFTTIISVRTYIGLGTLLCWLYDKFSFVWGPFPRHSGKIPVGQPTPEASLNLQPGELVRIKSYDEILETLNTSGKNKGLYFDAEMVPYCGRIYRVKKRVTRFLDEKSRQLVTVNTPCIVLESVVCQSRYSRCRMICPRSIYSWWREAWLERV